MPQDDLALKLKARFNKTKGARGQWEDLWDQVARLVRTGSEFTTRHAKGQKRNLHIFNSTAPHAVQRAAAGIHSLMVNPQTKWVNFTMVKRSLAELKSVRTYMMDVRDEVMHHINRRQFGFNTQSNELLQDIVAFGTGAFVFDDGLFEQRFEALPLQDLYLENQQSRDWDTVYRTFKLTPLDAVDKFGEENVSDQIKQMIKNDANALDTEIEYVHCVGPNTGRMAGRMDGENKEFSSVYLNCEHSHVCRVGGFDRMPYQVVRWSKVPGELFGRGPGIFMLPDISVINAMERTDLVAREKNVDPPYIVEANSIEGPINTAPGSLIFRRSGVVRDPITQLQQSSNLMLSENGINKKAENIERGFMLDMFSLPDIDRMTAEEVRARMSQRQQSFSPVLSRLQDEWLSPMIEGIVGFLQEQGRLPEAPPEIEGEEFKIEYTGPLAVAQEASELQNIQAWVQSTVIPLAQIDQTVLDRVDADVIVDKSADLLNVLPEAVRSDEEVNEIRQARQQAAQQQAQLDAAGQVAKAGKDAAAAGGLGLAG